MGGAAVLASALAFVLWSTSGTPGPTTAAATGPGVSSVSALAGRSAAGIAADHGIRVAGDVREAVQWQDANGRNLLLASRVLRPTAAGDAGSIVVVLVAHLDDRPTVLRTMTDFTGRSADDPCTGALGLDVVPGSVTVRDDDADGVGEATVGWFHSCHTDVGLYAARLAVLSGRRKFILRGQALPSAGTPHFTPAQREAAGLPAGTFTPDPAPDSWPVNSYERAVTLVHQLFL